MAVQQVNSRSERNKIIAAALLGVLALASLWFAFGPSLTGSSTKTTVSTSPTPRSGSSPRRDIDEVKMPSKAEQDLAYMVPVSYSPNAFGAPDPGRNIFAFYEPPPPCLDCPPPPTPFVTPPTPTPTPTPPYLVAFVSPQNVYAGSKSFRLEMNGDKFTPDAKLFFNGNELPTSFVSPQRLSANVPANMISGAGSAQVIARSPDGSKYSLPVMISIQAPPTPNFQYVGMIARARYNNDTAYFIEQGKPTPTGARLNDVVGGRFRLISIDAEKVIFEDTMLGFKHSVELYRPAPGTAGSTVPTGPGGRPLPQPGGFQPYNPSAPGVSQGIPGIPDGIPRYVPPNRNANVNANVKRPVDDEDDDNDNRRH